MRGKVLVFVATRQAAEDLTTALRQATTAAVDCLHGEKQQFDRSSVMAQFKKGSLRIVIATDVAARGLDVADVATGNVFPSVSMSDQLRRAAQYRHLRPPHRSRLSHRRRGFLARRRHHVTHGERRLLRGRAREAPANRGHCSLASPRNPRGEGDDAAAEGKRRFGLRRRGGCGRKGGRRVRRLFQTGEGGDARNRDGDGVAALQDALRPADQHLHHRGHAASGYTGAAAAVDADGGVRERKGDEGDADAAGDQLRRT